MFKKQTITVILALITLCAFTQEEEHFKYRRSSLYSILVSHPSQEFHKEIDEVFFTIPIPEKYNNHDLDIKVISSQEKKVEKLPGIEEFIKNNALPRRMIAKWFNRDPETGFFNMELIHERGHYDATALDVAQAAQTKRGASVMLADAGEELIKKTFLIVNDIKYLDKAKAGKTSGSVLKVAGTVATISTGDSRYAAAADKVGNLAEKIEGFQVTVTTHLFQLEWNDDVLTEFYESYYIDSTYFDPQKKEAFENNNELFKLKYVGSKSVSSGNTSIKGLNTETPHQMIRKVCTRSIDKSIVELQRTYEDFRVKTPITSVSPTINAKIGMKEGITAKNKFEVLEYTVDNKGRSVYKRVGIVKPKGVIWDNRYMAMEEDAANAHLSHTEFKKVSGNVEPGMLIRQIK